MKKYITILLTVLLCSCSNRRSFLIEIDNADGLTTSSSVYTNGLVIGKVEGFSISSRNSILVSISLNQQIKEVPLDSELKVINDGLLGGKAIVIVLGTSSRFINQSDTIDLRDNFEPMTSGDSEFEFLFMDKINKIDSILIELRRLNDNLEKRN
ncbi:MlaD family protein [Ekhidna sp.]